MKILVTGGAGFIGKRLVERLDGDWDNVIRVIDNYTEQVHGIIPDSKDQPHRDITSDDTWKELKHFQPDVIYHLASDTGTGQSMSDTTRYLTNNLIGTAKLLDFISNLSTQPRVILTSSRAVYGEEENHINTVPIPRSIYGLTKLVQEQMFSIMDNSNYTFLRLQNIYGPGQSLNNPYTGLISIFTKQLDLNQNVEVWDDGKPTRDFLYIDDAVDAIIRSRTDKTIGKTYDIGTGKGTPVIDVANKLKELLDSSGTVSKSSWHRPGDILHAVSESNYLFKRDTNWKCRVSIDEGLSKLIQWYKEL